MSIKKYSENEIIEAIKVVFGSIEDYARATGSTKQNVYGKVKVQSRKFIKELETAGVVLPGSQVNTGFVGGDNIQHSKVHIPQSKADIIRQLEQLDGEKEEVKLLRQENAEQKEEIKRLNAELLKCKDQIISILSKDRGQ